MTATSGMQGSLWVCDTPDGTYKKLARLSECNLRINASDIDTSNVDDLGWGSSIAGARSWEVTANSNLKLDDDGYKLLVVAQIANSDLYVKILTSGSPTVSPTGWGGKCGVGNTEITIAGTATQQKVSWSIKGRGPLSEILL